MSSVVKICNLALSRIGAARITSLLDGTETANLCNTLFDECAEDTMIEGPWVSTIRRQELAILDETPVSGYTYAYQLPVDPFCLKVLAVNELNTSITPASVTTRLLLSGAPTEELEFAEVGYKVEGRKLLTNEASVAIRYIAKLTDSEDYDDNLKRAIVSRMVAELVYPLTGDRTVSDRAWTKHEKTLERALELNSQIGYINNTGSTALTTDVR